MAAGNVTHPSVLHFVTASIDPLIICSLFPNQKRDSLVLFSDICSHGLRPLALFQSHSGTWPIPLSRTQSFIERIRLRFVWSMANGDIILYSVL